ncbi:MAG: rhodanese-like domain-containing protein [Bacteroidetes bacterium]|nr:MAG: rhodanese-like domain-containing protein [Bacteroidota bacterium]
MLTIIFFTMKNLLFIILIILSFTFQACKDASANTGTTDEIELISPQQVYDAVHSNETIQLVDVRTKEEFIESHLTGAQNICVTDEDFNEKIKNLDKNKPVYVYCKVGGRSADAAKKLKKMGFTKIYDMDGGILLWEEKKLATEK